MKLLYESLRSAAGAGGWWKEPRKNDRAQGGRAGKRGQGLCKGTPREQVTHAFPPLISSGYSRANTVPVFHLVSLQHEATGSGHETVFCSQAAYEVAFPPFEMTSTTLKENRQEDT